MDSRPTRASMRRHQRSLSNHRGHDRRHSFENPTEDRRRPRRSSPHSSQDSYRRCKRKRRSPPPENEDSSSTKRRRRADRDSPSPPRPKQRRNRRRRRQRPAQNEQPRAARASGGVMVSEEDEEGQPTERGSSSSHDDSQGHFRGSAGTEIANRYRVIREVGMGTFGRVVECLDLKRVRSRSYNDGLRVAIKVVRKVKRYYDSARIEADILDDINRRGGPGTFLCVVMHDAFTWKSHYCLVFENLGPSLYDFVKRHDHQPFPMVCVRAFCRQLLEALEFLHSFHLIHTDLKLENILLLNHREVSYRYRGRTYQVPESTRIKVIDFGGATYDDDKHSSVINTRQYRAPEVILGIGWSMPSDLWSAGCIFTELYTGELLFATHDNIEHLALIEKIIGPFPRRMLKNAKHSKIASEAFDSSAKHRLDRVLPSESASYVRKQVPLEAMIRKEDRKFVELLRALLMIDPDARATAHEALRFSV